MTIKKNTTDKTTAAKGSSDLPEAYIRLRTILDAIEISALRYCLKDANAAKIIKRVNEIEALLKPVNTRLRIKMHIRPGDCEDGFFNCGGYCVPYPCFIEMCNTINTNE